MNIKLFGKAVLVTTLFTTSILLFTGCGGASDDSTLTRDTYADTEHFKVAVIEDGFASINLGSGLVVEESEDSNDTGNGGIPGTGEIIEGDVKLLEYRVIQFPKNGKVYVSGSTLIYKPTPNWSGTDFVKLTKGKEEDLDFKYIEVIYNVKSINHAPTISFGTFSTTLNTKTYYKYTPVANDIDGDHLTFSVINRPSWATFDPATGTFEGTTYNYEDTYEDVWISVSDGEFTTSLEPFTLDVISNNHAPTITGTPSTLVYTGREYTFTPTGEDVDGDPLTYDVQNKPDWLDFDDTTGALSGFAPNYEEVFPDITISVTDDMDGAILPPFSINVVSNNHAPTISGTPLTNVEINATYNFKPLASDADGDTLLFTIQNKPAWITFDTSTGEMSGTSPEHEETYRDIEISVSDGIDVARLDLFDIEVIDTNHAPTIEGVPTTIISTQRDYYFKPMANDIDGDPLTFIIQNKPDWAQFNDATGEITGMTPNYDSVSSSIIVSVTDGSETTALAPFDIEVKDTNHAPTIEGVPTTIVTSGDAYYFKPLASDADGDTLTFYIANKPLWVTFNEQTGEMDGQTPDTNGTDVVFEDISIYVNDGSATAYLAPFSINVRGR